PASPLHLSFINTSVAADIIAKPSSIITIESPSLGDSLFFFLSLTETLTLPQRRSRLKDPPPLSRQAPTAALYSKSKTTTPQSRNPKPITHQTRHYPNLNIPFFPNPCSIEPSHSPL
ncbi:hypothetical protein CCACVL1_02359, partial [Corchorus capsularis]